MIKVSRILKAMASYTFEWVDSNFEYDGDYISGSAWFHCPETGTTFYVDKHGELNEHKNTAMEDEISDEEFEAALAWSEENPLPEEWIDGAYQDFKDGEAAARDAWSDSRRYFGH